MPMTSNAEPKNVLIYDAECFFCSNYVRLLNLRATIGEITLIDARDRETVAPYDLDPALLNEGMMLILEGKRYYGPDAIHHIALLSTSNSFFNRLNAAVFRSKTLSHLLYPALKLGRGTYLSLVGKEQIH